MSTPLVRFMVLAILACFRFAVTGARAGETRFFRIVGPTNSVITAFQGDGTLAWSNAANNATCSIQRAATLWPAADWQDYARIACTSRTIMVCVFDLNVPAGMARIPAGNFQMGDNFGDDEYQLELPVHTVYVSGFCMDKTGVTWDQWREVRDWGVTNGYDLGGVGAGKTNNHPVQSVNWYDCVKWCNARSQKDNLTPCYTLDGSSYKTGQVDNIVCDWSANGYRLPTEAEREKAARGGLSSKRFSWGATNAIDHTRANYYVDPSSARPAYDEGYEGYDTRYATNGVPYTSPAGSFAPNGYGLYDMSGNLWEWCWDWYDFYPDGSVANPHGPSTPSAYFLSVRVFRGGSWGNGADGTRVARREGNSPDDHNSYLGFRTVRAQGP